MNEHPNVGDEPGKRQAATAAGSARRRALALVVAIAGVLGGVAVMRSPALLNRLSTWAMGVHVDNDVRIAADDGTTLATTVLRPWWKFGALPTVLMRTPYGRLDMGRGYARKGYAVVVQDMRGRHDSGGVFEPYSRDTADATTTLDWIVQQPWSNGRVGTLGCSALGESQVIMARARHPAHRALVAESAGGGVGSAGGRYSYFGVYEGGVFQLASAFGWFARNGEKTPTAEVVGKDRIEAAVRSLPVLGMVSRLRSAPTDFDLLRTTPLGDARWDAMGYLTDRDRFGTPGLHVAGWYDQGVSETLEAAALMRRNADNEAARSQHVIIGPGLHCNDPGPARGTVGDLSFDHADQAFENTYLRWFDAWLRGDGSEVHDMPAYQVFVLNENRWLSSATWPPAGAQPVRWYLHGRGAANSRDGDGQLLPEPPPGPLVADTFVSDPSKPVPTRGGAFCCSGDPRAKEGPVDQADVETRRDVLVYTSEPLRDAMRIAGPIELSLDVATSAADTDFVAKLVDVQPDGRAINIQGGALRLRYRTGYETPTLAEPGRRYGVRIRLRDIAYLVQAGHRLRIQIAGSDFPRLERNLNTGGRNYDEVTGVVATNRVFHGADALSHVTFPVLAGR